MSTKTQAVVDTALKNKIDKAYKSFSATYYDPKDPRQTKINADGIGAFNKPVQFGDVAMGLRKYKQGDLVEIKELADIKTPYGNGIFRVNDKKNKRYNTGGDSFDIAIPTGTPNADQLKKRIGNNTFSFKIVSKQPVEKKIGYTNKNTSELPTLPSVLYPNLNSAVKSTTKKISYGQ